MDLPEVEDFMETCVPAFTLTLDELNGPWRTDPGSRLNFRQDGRKPAAIG